MHWFLELWKKPVISLTLLELAAAAGVFSALAMLLFLLSDIPNALEHQRFMRRFKRVAETTKPEGSADAGEP